jgi:cell division protein FtsL
LGQCGKKKRKISPVARFGAQANNAYSYEGYTVNDRGFGATYVRSSGAAVDRSNASVYYGGLFSNHRAGSSVYGGLLDDPVPPAAERRRERVRTTAAERGVRIGRYSRPAFPHISSSEKGIMVFVAVFVAVIFIGVIALEAYSVSIQHRINKSHAEAADIQKEMDEIYVSIEQGKNIEAIEKKAKKQLDMLYPSSEQIKYGKDIKVKDKGVDIAEDIRSDAYGT